MNEHQKKALEILMQLQDKIDPKTQFTPLAWFIMFGKIPYIESSNKEIKTFDVVKILDNLKKENSKQIVIVETPGKSVSLKLGDALIYEGQGGEIVLDSE